MNIGDNLKVIRNRNNVSQQEVADFLGVDRKTYVSWEAGMVDIKSSYIPKLAEFLHVEIKDLFREKSSGVVINQHNTDNKDSSINGIVLLLTDKEAVDQLVEVMKATFEKK
jgi:DNA-binding XRE family transcriptional regulator